MGRNCRVSLPRKTHLDDVVALDAALSIGLLAVTVSAFLVLRGVTELIRLRRSVVFLAMASGRLSANAQGEAGQGGSEDGHETLREENSIHVLVGRMIPVTWNPRKVFIDELTIIVWI